MISYDIQEEMKYEAKLKEALTFCKQEQLLSRLKKFYGK